MRKVEIPARTAPAGLLFSSRAAMRMRFARCKLELRGSQVGFAGSSFILKGEGLIVIFLYLA